MGIGVQAREGCVVYPPRARFRALLYAETGMAGLRAEKYRALLPSRLLPWDWKKSTPITRLNVRRAERSAAALRATACPVYAKGFRLRKSYAEIKRRDPSTASPTPRLAGLRDCGNASVVTATGGVVASGVWRSLLLGLCREWGMRRTRRIGGCARCCREQWRGA